MERADAIAAPRTPTPTGAKGESRPGDTRTRSLLLRWAPLLIAVTYFAVMMPIGAEMILHYPDERHYAYGGARMTETGNWLIPETPQGEVRLKKPILPYWFSAAGFEVLGIGVPGFRLFWVLAACGILLLTYATARALGASRQIAILAELMIAANPVFMRAATNSIPDVPLTLFVTAGALGFVKILAARDRPAAAAWAWLGWIGMALAVLSKGLLPVVLVATLIAYAALWDRARLAALLRPLPLLASIALVSGWYVYAATNYPVEFATQFFGDQITGNATRGPMWVLAYFPAYLLAGVFSFLGWPLMVLWLAAKTRPRLSPAPWPSPVRLLSLWCAVVVAVFAFSDAVDPRYLLPALPAFAVLLALALSALDGEELPESSRISRWLLPVAAVGGLVLAVPEALILAQLGEMPAVILMAAGAAAWVVIAAWGRQAPRLAPYFLAATPVLAMALLALAMAPVVLPDRGEQFAHRLAASGVSASRAAFVDDIHTASETRLHAGAAVPFTEEARLDDAIAAGNCVIMTTRAGLARRLAERGYTVTEIRAGWREIDVPSLLRAIVTLRLAEARDAHGSTGYFAECVETTAAAE